MAMGQNGGLPFAPDFNTHRLNVTVADAAPPSAAVLKPQGMSSQPFEDVYAQVQIVGGAGVSITLEVLFWSDLDQRFISQSPQIQFTAIAASRQIKFNTGGQRFFLNLTGTFGGCTVNINCAGCNPVQVQQA